MGNITLKVDLFCASCLTSLSIEESAGHHCLIELCEKCVQQRIDKAEKEIREEKEEETVSVKKYMSGKEKMKEWKKAEAERDEEKRMLREKGFPV